MQKRVDIHVELGANVTVCVPLQPTQKKYYPTYNPLRNLLVPRKEIRPTYGPSKNGFDSSKTNDKFSKTKRKYP